jgi:hypothetical protein
MNIKIELSENIVNLTTITTKLSNGYTTSSIQSMDTINLKSILSYAIPLSCLTILLSVVVFIGIRQRHRVLDKWTSLKRMRNTNPRFLESPALRRDSEFDSYNHDHGNSTSTSQENRPCSEQQYHLATIT